MTAFMNGTQDVMLIVFVLTRGSNLVLTRQFLLSAHLVFFTDLFCSALYFGLLHSVVYMYMFLPVIVHFCICFEMLVTETFRMLPIF
jgi:hypothetical protein